MTNPWLDIPLEDYEGHMTSPAVQQLEVLSDLFAEALAFRRPATVAVLGVAGGNGLDRVDSAITERVVGLDINPIYLDAVSERYAHLRGLELHCVDLKKQVFDTKLHPVQLVHASLFFEFAGVDTGLDNALKLVAPDGAISVVLQRPSSSESTVGKSGFASLQRLQTHVTLIDPLDFCALMHQQGFQLIHETENSLVGGKAFWMGIFVRP
jgi:hypothetical protein